MGARRRRKAIRPLLRRGSGYYWRFLREVFVEYIRDDCPLMAAAISFYVLLSLIPLLLVGLASFGYLLGDQGAFQAVFEAVDRVVPEAFGGTALRRYLSDNWRYLRDTFHRPRALVGVAGIATWVWAGSAGFSTIMRALNIVWGVQPRRGYLARRLLSIAMMVILGAMVLVSFGATSTLRIIQEYRIPWLGLRPGEIPIVWQVVGWAVPAALSVLVFVFCYTILADARIGVRPALIGGGVAGLLWEAAKQGFSLYVANFAHYDRVYGSLGGLVILVMWVYYSAAILLLGGEVASVAAAQSAPARGRTGR